MIDWTSIKEQTANLIQNDFWRYWRQHDDEEFGGVLNCISNDGAMRISDDKFSWSQGRYLWMLGELLELSEQGLLAAIDKKDLRECLDRCRRFILDTCIGPDNKVYYLLNRKGEPRPDERTGRLDASIFSDSFIIIGLSNAARVTKTGDAMDKLSLLYHSVVERIQSKSFLTEPYPIPEGYSTHSIPMILLNTSIEYLKALRAVSPEKSEEIAFCRRVADDCANKIQHKFLDPKTSLMREYLSTGENYKTRLLDRHVNPGHTIEDCWFLIEYHQENGTLEEALPWIEKLAQASWAIGWDQEYGGLLRFVDRDGGEPKGETSHDPFENLIRDTWSMKLWWPHSETLYTFLLLYRLNGNKKNLHIYETSADYIFRTFPDPVHGEWIQIRDREGKPEEKVVALPVKDPFHIVRNLCRILQLAAGVDFGF